TVARRQRIDIGLVSSEAQREPSLLLAAKMAEPMRRAVIGREFVRQPIGLAEIVGVAYAGLFPKFAHRGGAQVLVFVDAPRRHLPPPPRGTIFGPAARE